MVVNTFSLNGHIKKRVRFFQRVKIVSGKRKLLQFELCHCSNLKTKKLVTHILWYCVIQIIANIHFLSVSQYLCTPLHVICKSVVIEMQNSSNLCNYKQWSDPACCNTVHNINIYSNAKKSSTWLKMDI